ncbi:energy-coupling factor ABC transporter substrate-binding protein [Carboxylicivirga sp. RSCT41]|uniref:energy-coupling factor ABC transporter substrate-binding protein n=1 Tax=Carboxylicivirga agarovorans TaxID=3417570 RepID=UPI003D33968D
MKTNKKLTKQNYLLLLLVLLIPVIALWLGGDSEFGGADTIAVDLIDNGKQAYKPWFEALWAPPGGETESLLFALQAALGTGVLAYFIGYIKGKRVALNAK